MWWSWSKQEDVDQYKIVLGFVFVKRIVPEVSASFMFFSFNHN